MFEQIEFPNGCGLTLMFVTHLWVCLLKWLDRHAAELWRRRRRHRAGPVEHIETVGICLIQLLRLMIEIISKNWLENFQIWFSKFEIHGLKLLGILLSVDIVFCVWKLLTNRMM